MISDTTQAAISPEHRVRLAERGVDPAEWLETCARLDATYARVPPPPPEAWPLHDGPGKWIWSVMEGT